MNINRKEHWRTWYIAVVFFLLLQVVLYYLFTSYYR